MEHRRYVAMVATLSELRHGANGATHQHHGIDRNENISTRERKLPNAPLNGSLVQTGLPFLMGSIHWRPGTPRRRLHSKLNDLMDKIEKTSAEPPILELYVIISNRNVAQDTRLRFEFSPAGTAPRIWLVRLPALINYDGFPQPLTSGVWELRMEALADTHPLEITNCTRESAQAWIRQIHPARPEFGTAELLILAGQEKFTVAIKEF